MQANKQLINIVFGVNPIQFPVTFNQPIFLNNMAMPNYQNFNPTFLSNAPVNSPSLPQNSPQPNPSLLDNKGDRNGAKIKTNWTQQEDELLKLYVQKQKLQWNQIARKIPHRTYKMCYSRYQRLKEEKKLNWKEDEEKKIKQLISLFGKKWKHLSEFIPNRTPKQIRERYLNYLRPNLSQERWTEEEDQKLVEMISKYGHSWKTIEKYMSKRSQNQLKNRYYGKIKKEGEKEQQNHFQ